MTHYEVKCSSCGDNTLIVRGHDLDEVVRIMQEHENSPHENSHKKVDARDILSRTFVTTPIGVPEALLEITKIREAKTKRLVTQSA